MKINERIYEALKSVKEKSPLVYHITNYVTVNDCANITLAIGASPVMADDINEVEDMVNIASSVVLNIGTLNERTVESMIRAGKKGNELGKPVIFDPVGAGATPFRKNVCKRILEEVNIDVIRGNMSEVKVLIGVADEMRGVDSIADESDGKKIAVEAAQRFGCVVGITGKTDVISDGNRVCMINNGHKILSKVTGTGCMTNSLIGSYCGANKDYLIGATAGILTMALSGEKAYEDTFEKENNGNGIGTFKVRLFDNIYNFDKKMIMEDGRVEYEEL